MRWAHEIEELKQLWLYRICIVSFTDHERGCSLGDSAARFACVRPPLHLHMSCVAAQYQSGKLWSNLPFLESLPFLEGFSIYGYASSKNGYADDVIVPKYRKCCAYVGTYRFPPNMRQMRLSPLVAFNSP